MWLRPDYGNLYKFVVSTGLAFIGLAVALPWVVKQLTDGLLLSTEEVDALSPAARELWSARINAARSALRLWPWLSGGGLILGLTTATAGLVKWKAQQGIADARDRAELSRAELEVEAMTPSEIEAVAVTEAATEHRFEWADESAAPSSHAGAEVEVTKIKDAILGVETRVLILLQAAFKWSHEAQPHVRLQLRGQPRSVDALLKAKDHAYVDIIAEVKYLRAPHLLPQTLSEVAHVGRLYREATGRLVYTLVILVIARRANPAGSANRLDDIRRRVAWSAEVQSDSVMVAVLAEDELDELEPADLLTRLPSAIGQKWV